MASDMIEACGKRVWRHYENWMKKGGLITGTSSDYLLPSECCVMINVILDCKAQVIDQMNKSLSLFFNHFQGVETLRIEQWRSSSISHAHR